jgi:hypothetical protein
MGKYEKFIRTIIRKSWSYENYSGDTGIDEKVMQYISLLGSTALFLGLGLLLSFPNPIHSR